MALIKVPYQNLQINAPEEGEVFKTSDPSTFGYRQGGKLYTFNVGPLSPGWGTGLYTGNVFTGERESDSVRTGTELLGSKYGINVGALASYNLADVQNFLGTPSGGDVNLASQLFKGFQAPATAETITRTIDPNNPNAYIDISSLSGKTPPAPPENYLANLLGQGQGVGGAYTAVSPAAPLASLTGNIQVGASTIFKPYFRYSNANEVYNVKTGQHITAEEAAKIPDFWSNVEVVQPGLKVLYGGTPAPPPSNNITSENLQGGIGITLPQISGGTNDASAMVVGATSYSKSLQDYITQLTPAPTATETQYQNILNQIAGLTGQEAGKAAEQLTQEQTQRIPELKKQLSDINAQILTKTAEYEALKTDIQGKPITMSSIIGSQAQIERVKASEIGMLTARGQALTGQISVAQETANRAIDLKYSTIEAQLNVYQAQLNALLPTLNKEEKVLAIAQQAMIDDRNQAIADAKTTEKNLTNYLLDSISKYPSASISLSDTYQTAQQKILNSAEYKQVMTKTEPDQWSDPYLMGGDYVQKNLKTGEIRTAVNVAKAPQPSASEKRDTAVSTYLNENKGTDGFVSASTYQNALTKFIAGGGSQSNFTAAYPQQTYLRQQEIDKLPAALRPQQIITKTDLSSDQVSIINDAKAAIDQVKQRLGDWNTIRSQIIDQVKQQYGWDISPYL